MPRVLVLNGGKDDCTTLLTRAHFDQIAKADDAALLGAARGALTSCRRRAGLVVALA